MPDTLIAGAGAEQCSKNTAKAKHKIYSAQSDIMRHIKTYHAVHVHLLWPVDRLLRLIQVHKLSESVCALQTRLLCPVKVCQLRWRADCKHAQRCGPGLWPCYRGPVHQRRASKHATRKHRDRRHGWEDWAHRSGNATNWPQDLYGVLQKIIMDLQQSKTLFCMLVLSYTLIACTM